MDDRHKAILRNNNVLLTKYLTVDEEFLSYFTTNRVMTDANVEEILVEKTAQKKNGQFLRNIIRRGPRAFPTIIESLVATNQDHLAEKLDLKETQKWRKLHDNSEMPMSGVQETTPPVSTVTPAFPTQKHNNRTASDLKPKVNNEGSAFMTVNITPSNLTEEGFQRLLGDRENVYSILPRKRGRAIIINNERFMTTGEGPKLSEREGTGYDLINLTTLFTGLHFETRVHNNCDKKEILKILDEESRNPAHQEADAFILCVLSHGAQGYAYGIDGNKISIENEICAQFDGNHCQALRGKPKIFIIQACQGKESTVGVPVADSDGMDDLSANLKELQMGDVQDAAPQFFGPGPKKHEKADMLIAYSTVGGYKSWRRPDLGSWFIRAIVDIFAEWAHSEHIADLFTKVNRRVLEMQTSYGAGDIYVQVTKTDTTLSKKFFIFPGYVARV